MNEWSWLGLFALLIVFVMIDSVRWWREQNRMAAKLDALLKRMEEQDADTQSEEI